MSGFLTLDQACEQQLGLLPDAGLIYARRAHLLPLTVADVGQAVCDFPVLISRNSHDASLMLSALTSFVPGHNLLADSQGWQAIYRPLIMQAYPCYCIVEAGRPQFIFAMDDSVLAIAGDALTDARGVLSSQAQRLTQHAQDLYDKERQTYLCLQQLKAHHLLRAIELQLQPEQGELQRIRGLMTIDEDKLHSLDGATLKALQQAGSLQLAQCMLNSLLQMNRLIQKHNQHAGSGALSFNRIQKLKIEIDRDSGFL
jgi:hypothetical protein